ncbi:aspartate/glutamate racemase family protein [Pantoea sp. MBD-2R]|uniref:aspartate/glutamate racemase family protein n=1 Tax=unclassified Pantoea TaxID=2630326 RepID=UPI0011BF19DA|nr:aspartate/glutamate racemase family protein [Pantoea sp. CCBC3-3-1]
MATIACLHAARSNIDIYEQALQVLEYDDIQLLHRVEDRLFEQALASNALTPDIADATRQAIEEMCQHADAVIVTCTTLGASACDASQFSKPVFRVDATLAKAASRYHGSILVLCTAHSTLEATQRIFAAFIPGERLAVELIPRAWAFFNSGDEEGYYRQIADYIKQRPECSLGCIVLAQSSMARAEKYINSTLAVLTGPEVSLQTAIEAII